MKAGTKRIVWALGWFLATAINDYINFKITGKYKANSGKMIIELLIWIMPLFFFGDD